MEQYFYARALLQCAHDKSTIFVVNSSHASREQGMLRLLKDTATRLQKKANANF